MITPIVLQGYFSWLSAFVPGSAPYANEKVVASLPALNLPSGQLADRIGRKPLIVAGMTGMAAGDLLTASCPQLLGTRPLLTGTTLSFTLNLGTLSPK